MTPEIEQMSAAVAQHFGWWKPGHCEGHPNAKFLHPDNRVIAKLYCEHGAIGEHEIPPPDLMQPEWFVRLLKSLTGVSLEQDPDYKTWVATLWPPNSDTPYHDDAETPELALLRAAYGMV